MGFRQKSRGIKVRRYEVVAIVLGLLTAATGIGWQAISPQSGWIVAPARVTGVSAGEGISDTGTMYLDFEYVVAGVVYRGKTRFAPGAEMLYGTLPEHIQAQLRERGYLDFNDLPPEAQALLRERFVSGFDKVPVGFLAAMEAQGYGKVSDIPDDIRQMVRDGDYVAAAEKMGYTEAVVAALIAGSVVPDERALRDSDGVRPASVLSGAAGFNNAPGFPGLIIPGRALQVRYDPAHPARHEIVRIPYLETISRFSILLALALITVIYCGVIYPRLKQS